MKTPRLIAPLFKGVLVENLTNEQLRILIVSLEERTEKLENEVKQVGEIYGLLTYSELEDTKNIYYDLVKEKRNRIKEIKWKY